MRARVGRSVACRSCRSNFEPRTLCEVSSLEPRTISMKALIIGQDGSTPMGRKNEKRSATREGIQ